VRERAVDHCTLPSALLRAQHARLCCVQLCAALWLPRARSGYPHPLAFAHIFMISAFAYPVCALMSGPALAR